MNEKILVKVRNISKSFGDTIVLRDVTFDIIKDEVLAICGCSGSGKSVLLRQIIKLDSKDFGEIFYSDELRDKKKKKTTSFSKSKIGMLFQNGALFDFMTVEENISFYLELNKKNHSERFSKEEINEIVNQSLSWVGLEKSGHLMPSQLSGGMKKRAALARVIAYTPKLLLCDEPTTGLDPITAKSISQLICRLRDEKGITSVVVTHDLNSAFLIADRIALHHEGKIIHIGTKENFYRSNHFIIKEFINSVNQDLQKNFI